MRQALLFLLFLILGLGWLQPLDRFAHDLLYLGPWQLVIWSSHCGDLIAYVTAGLTALWLFRVGRNELPVYGLLLAGQHFLTQFFKWLFHTVRPEHLHPVGGYAYPSGHAIMAVCVYGYLSTRTSGWKRLAFGMMPLVVAWSRVALGHHWLSDVTGGLLLGVMWLRFLTIS